MTLQKKIDHEFMGTFGPEIWAILRGETAPNEHFFKNWLKTSGGTLRQDNCQLIGQSLIVLARQAQKDRN